jgi:propanediol dehydratase small subunit
MDEQMIRQIMTEVVKNLGGNDVSFAKKGNGSGITADQYPLSEHIPTQLKSASGKTLPEFSFEKVISGELGAQDFRISAESLRMQADVAESVGRDGFANNLRRAAELSVVPDEEVLAAYNALRPYRSTEAELLALADNLQSKYGCTVTADFIREACTVYKARGRLKAS